MENQHITSKKKLLPNDEWQLYNLWNSEYPKSLSYDSLEAFLAYLGRLSEVTHHLIYNKDEIIAWSFSFMRDENTWFGILISPDFQGLMLGNLLMENLKAHHKQLNGWVIDQDDFKKNSGEAYRSPLNFYLKLGFKVLPENRIDNEQIKAVQINWRKNLI